MKIFKHRQRLKIFKHRQRSKTFKHRQQPCLCGCGDVFHVLELPEEEIKIVVSRENTARVSWISLFHKGKHVRLGIHDGSDPEDVEIYPDGKLVFMNFSQRQCEDI